jgi:hypothetical protein
MRKNWKTIVLLASICAGCAASVPEADEPATPSASAEKPRCLVADPFKPAAATAQVAREDYLQRVPESAKRELKASVERTTPAPLVPQRVDAAMLAKQAAYLVRARTLADGFTGTKDELDAAVGKLKRDVLGGDVVK